MSLLLTFWLALSAGANPQDNSAACEHLLIEASSRFQRLNYQPPHPEPATVIPFGRLPIQALRPFLGPIEVTEQEFLNDRELSNQLPSLRDFLLAQRNPARRPLRGYVAVSVSRIELKSFLARGVLARPESGLAREKIISTRNERLTPATGEIYLVFRREAEQLAARTGEYPIWSLLAIVPRDLIVVKRMANQALGTALGLSLVTEEWPAPRRRVVPNTRPLVFNLDLNPFEVFAMKEPMTDAEASRMRFDRLPFESLEDDMEKLSFWLPFARSLFRIEDHFGNVIEGRPVQLRQVGRFSYEPTLTFRGEDGLDRQIDLGDVAEIEMLEYVPNGPDRKRLNLSRPDLYELDSFWSDFISQPDRAQRLLILRR